MMLTLRYLATSGLAMYPKQFQPACHGVGHIYHWFDAPLASDLKHQARLLVGYQRQQYGKMPQSVKSKEFYWKASPPETAVKVCRRLSSFATSSDSL
jgi:hypothetical protein